MSKVTWKQIHKLTEEERWDIRGYDDVISIFGTNNIEDFPKDFDVKDHLHEELNICDKCGAIREWANEMYWQGEEDWGTNVILWDYTAVCDECYYELSGKWKAKLRILYYLIYGKLGVHYVVLFFRKMNRKIKEKTNER